MPKILLADDHPLFRTGTKHFLSSEFDDIIVDEASNGQEAIDSVHNNLYDAVVLDLSLPDINGLEVLKRLLKINPELPVLILSLHDEELHAEEAIKAGAAGYLVKKGDPRELSKALKIVINGGKYISSRIFKRLISGIDDKAGESEHEILSKRELQVMKMIASGKRLKEIAEELSLSVSAVSTHRTRVLSKMDMKGNADIVRYAVKVGWLD